MMSDENTRNNWTAGQVKELVEKLLVEHDRRYEQRFKAQEQALVTSMSTSDKALNKAEEAADKRFEIANDVKAIVLSRIEAVERTIAAQTGAEARAAQSRQGLMWFVALIAGLLGAAISGAVGWLFKK